MDLQSQYEALHAGSVFAPMSLTRIRVTGADRISFLHNLCTNDIRQLEVSRGCEAFFTTVQGKVLNLAFLFCHEQAIEIVCQPDQASVLIPHLDKYIIREDVVLEEVQDEALIYLAGEALPDPLKATLSSLRMLDHGAIAWNQWTGHAYRVPLAVVPCFLVSSKAGASWEAALAAESIPSVSKELLELARIEARFPAFGRDITVDNLPQEVGRDESAISFTKGCYLGQETVARIDALGHVNRNLVQLSLESSEVPTGDLELQSGDKVVGRITSASYSPTQQRTLALGYVRRDVDTDTLRCELGKVQVIR